MLSRNSDAGLKRVGLPRTFEEGDGEMESGKWEEGKERDSKLHGMSLVTFKGLFSQQKEDFTFLFFPLLDICYGLTSLVRMMQVESCPSLFSKRASEVGLL